MVLYSFFTPPACMNPTMVPYNAARIAAKAPLERQDEDRWHGEGDGQVLERSDTQRDGPLEDVQGYSAPPSMISTVMVSTADLHPMTASLSKERMFRPL